MCAALIWPRHPAVAPSGPLRPCSEPYVHALRFGQMLDMRVLPCDTQMLLASVGGACVLDMRDRQRRLHPLGTPGADAAFCIDSSPDGQSIVTGALGSDLALWRHGDYGTPSQILSVPDTHRAPVAMGYFQQCAIACQIGLVVGLHATGQVFLWRLDTPKPRGAFHVGDPACKSMCLSPNGRMLATGCTDGYVYLRQTIAEAPFVPMLKRHFTAADITSAMAFSPDGGYLALGLVTGDISLWDWQNPTAQLSPRLGGHASPVQSLAWA